MTESAVAIPQTQSISAAKRPMPADRPVNVGDLERGLSLLGGSTLALYSLRRSLVPLALFFGAGALIYRGLTGHCALYQTMAVSTTAHNTPSDRTDDATGADNTSRIVIAHS